MTLPPALTTRLNALLGERKELWFGGSADPAALPQTWEALLGVALPSLEELSDSKDFATLEDAFHVICMHLSTAFYPPRRMTVYDQTSAPAATPEETHAVAINTSNKSWHVATRLGPRGTPRRCALCDRRRH